MIATNFLRLFSILAYVNPNVFFFLTSPDDFSPALLATLWTGLCSDKPNLLVCDIIAMNLEEENFGTLQSMTVDDNVGRHLQIVPMNSQPVHYTIYQSLYEYSE